MQFEHGKAYRMSGSYHWEYLGLSDSGRHMFQRLSDTWTVEVDNPILDDNGNLSWDGSYKGHWIVNDPVNHLIPLTKPPMFGVSGTIICYRCTGCIHKDAYRRNPKSIGGLALCMRLRAK